jgi:hypothetical protein
MIQDFILFSIKPATGGLVNHQQMLILKNHARRHAQMKLFFNHKMKAWNNKLLVDLTRGQAVRAPIFSACIWPICDSGLDPVVV